MVYQWYPGHMTKAVRMMQEQLQLIDLIIELVDARVPLSSRNPDIDKLGKNKFRIILLNKSDLADPKQNAAWKAYFETQGIQVLELDARNNKFGSKLKDLVKTACAEKIERDRKRGIKNRPIRAMVCGIPNVGKSTFINSFVGKTAAKTGNKPGVTKGKQWIRLNDSLELLDTPGILWPKFDDQEVGMKLAVIGSMNDEVIVIEELACSLIDLLKQRYPAALSDRYGELEGNSSAEVLASIAFARKALLKGEEPDLVKASNILLDDYRSGRLGKLTLESPEDKKVEDEK